MAKRRAFQQVPAVTYAIPAIAVKSDVSEARARVGNILGKNFADKVSDRFVYRAVSRMKISPAALIGDGDRNTDGRRSRLVGDSPRNSSAARLCRKRIPR